MSTMTVRRARGARSRLLAFMSYLGILCFVPLFTNKGDEYVAFHAKQGLIIWMLGVIGIFALYLPSFGKFMFSAAVMAVVVYSAIGAASVLLNRAWKLPGVHSVATYL